MELIEKYLGEAKKRRSKKTMRVRVKFDLEDQGEKLSYKEAGVKPIMNIPSDLEDDEISDWISDKTGWAVLKWTKI